MGKDIHYPREDDTPLNREERILEDKEDKGKLGAQTLEHDSTLGANSAEVNHLLAGAPDILLQTRSTFHIYSVARLAFRTTWAISRFVSIKLGSQRVGAGERWVSRSCCK